MGYGIAVAKEQAEHGRETSPPGDDALRCAACGHRITDRAYRAERGGAHEHVFVNPAGFSFRIGCFVAAPGCAQVGTTSEAFSWFPGWTWQVVVCGSCRIHVGWIFRCAGEQFHGLIVAALR
jgi:hypothetical protein